MHKKGAVWLVLLGILMALSVVGPNLWAAPGQSLDRPTFPTPTTPAAPPPTQPPATATTSSSAPQPTGTPTPTEEDVPAASPEVSPTAEATITPTVLRTEVPTMDTPGASPTSAAGMPEGELPTRTPVSPVGPSGTDDDRTATPSGLQAPDSLAPVQARVQGEVEGISLFFCAGAVLVMAGLILLVVGRWGRRRVANE